MKFLCDQDVYAITVRFLRTLGHEVVTAAELNLSRADDEVLLETAHEQGRLMVTRDRDFGSLVFVHRSEAGVLYLRILPTTQSAVHAELANVLTRYTEEELQGAFLVIEPGRHRFRKPKDESA